MSEEQTWTFVGHWDNDRIIVEYVLPGEVVDVREDTGFWEQGLWAASGTGTDQDATMADVIAEYEAEYNDDEDEEPLRPTGPRGCGDCGAPGNSYHAGNCDV